MLIRLVRFAFDLGEKGVSFTQQSLPVVVSVVLLWVRGCIAHVTVFVFFLLFFFYSWRTAL